MSELLNLWDKHINELYLQDIFVEAIKVNEHTYRLVLEYILNSKELFKNYFLKGPIEYKGVPIVIDNQLYNYEFVVSLKDYQLEKIKELEGDK